MAHAGRHKGMKATVKILSKSYEWPSLRDDVILLVKGCIHCESADPRALINQQLGHLYRSDKPGNGLGLDFWSPGGTGNRSILTMRDDFSGFTWFKPVAEETADIVAKAIIEWATLFGMPTSIHTDNGKQFVGKVISELQQKYKFRLVTSYADLHFTHGTVERSHKELNKIIKCLLSEFQLGNEQWEEVIPLANEAVNSTPTERLMWRSPRQVMTGLDSKSNLDMILGAKGEWIQRKDWIDRQTKEITEAANLYNSTINELYEKFNPEKPKEQIEKEKKEYERMTNQFLPTQMVLVAKSPRDTTHKLDRKWYGPLIVMEQVSQHSYNLYDPWREEEILMHPARMKPFEHDGEPETFNHQRRSQMDEFKVDKIKQIRKRPVEADGYHEYEVLIRWSGNISHFEQWEEFNSAWKLE
jgi:hypothetical protein